MKSAPPDSAPPIAVTMGEPAGIGGDLILRAWRERREHDLPVFYCLDCPDRLARLAARLGWHDARAQIIESPREARAVFDTALPVIPTPLPHPPQPGAPDPAHTPAVVASIGRAVAHTHAGAAAGMVTMPAHKKTLYAGGFTHPGHTEYLRALAGADAAVMMLACDALRVALVTVHLPLRAVADALSIEKVVMAGRIAHRALAQDFGIPAPRLALAALNPHAGEDGALGAEEETILRPAVARLRALGAPCAGPEPADTLFHADARANYDCVLCLYHDQALIPLKTLDFWGGVNVTLGLPFVRTSPDHGTALSLAGTGRANPTSFFNALRLAADMGARRRARA